VHIYWISGNFTSEESVFRWNLVSLLSKLMSVLAFSAMKAYPVVDGDLKLKSAVSALIAFEVNVKRFD
jgi:hypothetical protein